MWFQISTAIFFYMFSNYTTTLTNSFLHNIVASDLTYIKRWTNKELIPTFANVCLSVKNGSDKLRKQIKLNIRKNKAGLKQEIKALSVQLKIALTMLVYITLLRPIKGHLHYKTKTSQNVPSKAQINNFFIS